MELKQRVNDMEDQSRRSNLRFYKIPEAKPGQSENCEEIITEFITEINQDSNDKRAVWIERAHRVGKREEGKGPRPVIVKFNYYKQKEYVLKHARTTEDAKFGVGEDFCKDTVEFRKELGKYIDIAKERNNLVTGGHISYKTLVLKFKGSNDSTIYRRRTMSDIKEKPDTWYWVNME